MLHKEKFNLYSLYAYMVECFKPPIIYLEEAYIGRVLEILFPESNWNNTW